MAAWRTAFADVPEVEVHHGDLIAVARTPDRCDALVSPANSFGYMDGGIDLVYTQALGWDMEKRLRALLLAEHDGELPVGQAVVVETGHQHPRWLISAPTMRVPMRVDTRAHAHLAFRAVLRCIKRHNASGTDHPIRRVICPGLGTGVGLLSPDLCALQMRHAWSVVIEGKTHRLGGLAAAVRQHMVLVGKM